jgi:hypothetical protein
MQKAGKILGRQNHKIDVVGKTLRKRKMIDNADTLGGSRHAHRDHNGAAGSSLRSHNHGKDGGTWRNRKHRSRRNYTPAHNRKRRKPKPTWTQM